MEPKEESMLTWLAEVVAGGHLDGAPLGISKKIIAEEARMG